MTMLGDLSDEQLADSIITWAGRVAAGEAEQLGLIAEFDRREAWSGPGLLSCAHWLSWRTGLSPVAAREKVRVARALDGLPLIAGEFTAGRLSYSQVRAITRVATAADAQTWVDVARNATAGQLEKLVRGVRRVQHVAEAEADSELAAHRLRATKTFDADGHAVYRIVLPAEDAAVLDAALEAMRTDLDRQAREADDDSAEAGCPQPPASERAAKAGSEPVAAEPVGEPPPARASLRDAFLAMARTTLDQQAAEQPSRARRSRSKLVAHIDPLSGWGRLRDGELLPPTSLWAVLSTLPGRSGTLALRPVTDRDLRAHDLGRKQRLPSLALRELIGTLDGERCRFPGCTRHRRLHAHHVVHWENGGPTDLDNLVLVCSRHHTLIHASGFAMTLHPDRRLSVHTADGVPVRHLPDLPWRPAEELARTGIDADTLPPDSIEARMDLRYVVSVLLQQAA
jgi:hypothetical protein